MRIAWVVAIASLAAGCGKSEKDEADDAPASQGGSTGGSVATGGRSASGGAVNTGGSPSTGGRVATGGNDATGGDDATGGTDATGGGTASGGAAGAAGGGAGDVEAGQCRELARLRFSTGDHYAAGWGVSRLPDGFALGDSSAAASPGLVGDEAGAVRDVAQNLPPVDSSALTMAWVFAGTARDPRFVTVRRKDSAEGYQGHFAEQSYLESGETAGPEREVLEVFTRGSALNGFARSSDGERVAIANGHGGTWDPRVVLVDKDGEPVSGELLLLDTGNSPAIDCLTMIGTQHGVLVEVVDGEADQLHLIELDAAGEIAQQLTTPHSGYCPQVSVDPSGIYASISRGDGSAGTEVYRVADGSLTKLLALPTVPSGEFDRWVLGGDEPLVLHSRGQEQTFARWKGGALVPLSGTFSGDLVRSPLDGRIFLATREDYAITITEVECGLAAP